MRHRKRVDPCIPQFAGVSDFWDYSSRSWMYPRNSSVPYIGRYYSLEDCWDELHPGPPYVRGGPFRLFKHIDQSNMLKSGGIYYDSITGQPNSRYRGGFYPYFRPWYQDGDVNPLFPDINSKIGDQSSYGPTGWHRYRPGNPTAQAYVFLSEWRDLPRMYRETAKGFRDIWKSLGGDFGSWTPKSVANQWLNTQFGWRPFLNDLHRFYKTCVHFDAILRRIRRDNNHWVKRGGNVTRSYEEKTVWSDSTHTAHAPILNASFYKNSSITGSTTIKRHKTVDVWFESRWRYWIPYDLESPMIRLKIWSQLMGLVPTPVQIWEAIPWSWLVDWSTNVSDMLANLTSGYADNLVAKDAFLMATTRLDYELTSTCNLKSGSLTDSWYSNIIWKTRTLASPFGFSIDDTSFSPYQWSILAALGLTRY